MCAQLFVDPKAHHRQAAMLRILIGLALVGAVAGEETQVECKFVRGKSAEM